jgi:hypothetical protein
MDPKERIERFITDTNVDIDSAGDRQVLRDVLQTHREFKQKHERKRQPRIWRSIMHTRTTKLATAATITLAVGLFLIASNWMAKPAWALAQTIEAFKSVKAIHIAGRVHYPDRQIDAEIEIWAAASGSDPAVSGDFRYHEGDDHVCVASERENLTYVSTRLGTPAVTVVYITEGLNRQGPIFPSGDMLEEFKKAAENWQEEYRTDPATGGPCVYVTFAGPAINTARYWLIQIDLQTKLPVRAAVWFDENRQGPAHFEYSGVTYNPTLPAGLFEFSMPAGAQVVDCRKIRKILVETPGLGLPVGGLSCEDACKKVAQAYWQAVIAQDWAAARKLRPLASDELSTLYTGNPPVELLGIPRMNHVEDPGTLVEVTTVIKLKDGTTHKSLLNVDLRDTAAGRVGVIAGTLGPEFYESN